MVNRVHLCLGKYAATPFFFERERMHIYSIEELCYYLHENAWMLEETAFDESLTDWIGTECDLPQLAQRLRAMKKSGAGAGRLLAEILSFCGYYSGQEIEKLRQQLEEAADVSRAEKQKRRADHFLETGRPGMALQEYITLLEEEQLIPSFRGKIFHNMGVARARLFLFEKAAESFEKAYRLTGAPESLQAFLAAKRMHLSEAEYLNFLTKHSEYYEASLELEKQMVERRQSWTDSRNDSVVASIKGAFFAGEEEECARLMLTETEKLKAKYREM